MNESRWSCQNRIAEQRRRLNALSIELYLAAQDRRDGWQLTRIVGSLEAAATELERVKDEVGVRGVAPL